MSRENAIFDNRTFAKKSLKIQRVVKEGRHFGRFAFLLLYAYLSLMRRLRGPQKAMIWDPFGAFWCPKMVQYSKWDGTLMPKSDQK